jgi:hypothetical protein
MKKLIAVATLALVAWLPAAALAQAPQQGAPEAPPAPPPPNPRAVRALKLRFEKEPAVSQVQSAALTYFKVHPDKVASYLRGAAWKALMPDVEVNFNNEMGTNDRRLRDITFLNTEGSMRCSGGPGCTEGYFPQKEYERVSRGSIVLGVRAHWALDRLIFNAETLDVSSLVGVQEGLLREITSLYFTRRRLLTSMTLNPPQDPNEEITEKLRLEEITANIDALTGGFLSRENKKRLGHE